MLQAHAASAVLNVSENCTPDILVPYLDGIVSKLLVLLQVHNYATQQGIFIQGKFFVFLLGGVWTYVNIILAV